MIGERRDELKRDEVETRITNYNVCGDMGAVIWAENAAGIWVCMCVCVRVKENIYVCVCVCVCVLNRQMDRQK